MGTTGMVLKPAIYTTLAAHNSATALRNNGYCYCTTTQHTLEGLMQHHKWLDRGNTLDNLVKLFLDR